MNQLLQSGQYARGEAALRQYLKRHPGDRSARAILRQLTVDPRQALGEGSQAHVVQAGESYSTLASRYLGSADLFLLLARYNGSTNPSLLRAGETLQIPTAAGRPVGLDPARGVTDHDLSAPSAATAPVTPAARARQLQSEGVALLDQGHRDQALARLDQALAIDPELPPDGASASALRTQLLDSYHERAIMLYRDQRLDEAIALWNKLLAIAPAYEPAVIYRARALELKQRLKQY